MMKSFRLRVLRDASFNREELDKKALLTAFGYVVFFGWFFYRSIWAMAPLTALLPVFYKKQKEKHFQKQQDLLKSRVCEWLKSVSANLRAGYSIENAIREGRKELVMLYGKEDPLARALKPVTVGFENNIPVEKLLTQLSEDVPVEELKDFSEIFRIARKSSGNLTEIIDHTTTIIAEKTLVGKEIRTMVAAKEMEQKIMSCMPFAIICYISVSSPGYFDRLYHNPIGVLIMTLNLAVYLMSLHLSGKILQIPV
ncbi:MAG: hypothetical protein K6A92_10775 [Lachnospiraceae bacterium]|nr:hypothetical protein [Lachnospiraceae bacterium]